MFPDIKFDCTYTGYMCARCNKWHPEMCGMWSECDNFGCEERGPHHCCEDKECNNFVAYIEEVD